MNKKGYTLVELIIVITIISILSLITYPVYTNYVNRSTEISVKIKMHYLIEITYNYLNDLENQRVRFGIEEFKYSYNTNKYYIIRKEYLVEYFNNYPIFNNQQDAFIGIQVTWDKREDISTYKYTILDIFYIINKDNCLRYYNNHYIDYNSKKYKDEFKEVYNYLKNYTLYDRYKII